MSFLIYIGTYTGPGKGEGIYRAQFDFKTGRLTQPELAAPIVNPSFLALHPSSEFLYAVNEVDEHDGVKEGFVSAYSIEARTGQLTFLNRAISAGRGPCHLTVDKTGQGVFVGNYVSGSVALLSFIGRRLHGPSTWIAHKGSSVNPTRQTSPHIHSVNVSPDNRFLFVADLGKDVLMVYPFHFTPDIREPVLDTKNARPIPAQPGAGPRHFTFHPDGRHAYLLNELHNNIVVYQYEAATGGLTERQTITTLPPDFSGISYTAEILVHPTGKFLYNSNRGHDSIAAFRIDPENGRLSSIGIYPSGGNWPRNFAIDPTGQWLLAANENSHNIVTFRIDPTTGTLSDTGQVVSVTAPACIKFLVHEKFNPPAAFRLASDS